MVLDLKQLGQKIKEVREKSNLTQEQLAERVDLSVTHISAIENASSGISLQALANIAEDLGVSMDWLIFDQAGGTVFFEHQINRLLADCNTAEAEFLYNVLKQNKEALREYNNRSK